MQKGKGVEVQRSNLAKSAKLLGQFRTGTKLRLVVTE